MNRLTENDRNWGPITVGRWSNRISLTLESGDDEDRECLLLMVAFGWALRIRVFNWLCRPWQARWVECNWDAETVKRLGRSGYWEIHKRQFGFSLSNMGNGYDFLQCFFGPQTHDSSSTKSWSKHLPWKMWDCVRHSLYLPDGSHYYTEDREKGHWDRWYDAKQKCPCCHFAFEDYDGAKIIATCVIAEREWHRGEGWFKWLKWFYPRKIRRSLDLSFNAEVGPEKGSWKGGTIGHGIDMEPGETPQQAFERYCGMEHERKGREFRLKFIGPCGPPPPKPKPVEEPCVNSGNPIAKS